MPAPTAVSENLAQKHTERKAENETPQESSPAPGKKKRGRPPGTKSQGGANASRLGGVQSKAERDNAAQDAQRLAAAALVTDMMERSGFAIAGDIAIMPDIEKTAIVGTMDNYFAKLGINDIPPGLALVLVTGQYYARVFTAPAAQPKVSMIKAWFGAKLKGIKNARSNRRNDKQRKNDTSETTSPDLPKTAN